MLLGLLWAVRVYTWLIIIWALSSWFGGIPGPVGLFLNTLMWPIWKLFGWANLGPVNLGGVIALFILFGFESYLKNQLGQGMQGKYETGQEQEEQDR